MKVKKNPLKSLKTYSQINILSKTGLQSYNHTIYKSTNYENILSKLMTKATKKAIT